MQGETQKADNVRKTRAAVQPISVPKVREKMCKSILNKCSISDYSLNCYVGCQHGCVYCYARFMQRFHPHPEPWGGFVDVKVNAVEVLKRQLRRSRPGEVFVSSACDGWQPIEQERRLTKECCRLLLEKGFQVNVLTKSSFVLNDIDVFAERRARIGVTLTTLDERLRLLWEPGASGIEERIRIIDLARSAGLETAIMFGPLLPFLSDSQGSINALFERAAELKTDIIWVDTLNPRPMVWPSVVGLLNKEFPDLRERYRGILFDPPTRATYVEELRQRISRAAQRFHVSDRVAGCP